MCAQLNVNLAGVEGQTGFEPLPPGWYSARVVDSEIKEGPKGNYIRWTFEINGKPNRVWDTMSLSNEVSMQRLKGLAVAVKHPNPNFIADTEELHGKGCMVRLKVEVDPSGKYDPKNTISAFKPIDGNGSVPPQIAEASATAPKAPVAPPAKMPWDR